MSKPTIWIKKAELPPKALRALTAFCNAFGVGNSGLVIVHCRHDALFVQVYGILVPYRLVSFIRDYPDIYLELEAAAPGFINVRMFLSDWMIENEVSRQRRWMEQKLPEINPENLPNEFRKRIDN